VVIAVTLAGRQDPAKTGKVPDEGPVEKLAAASADPPFHDGIHPGHPDAAAHDPRTGRGELGLHAVRAAFQGAADGGGCLAYQVGRECLPRVAVDAFRRVDQAQGRARRSPALDMDLLAVDEQLGLEPISYLLARQQEQPFGYPGPAQRHGSPAARALGSGCSFPLTPGVPLVYSM
jgi:hypothetical protein